MPVRLAAAIDEWEGSVEKELSCVVRQLPKADSTLKLECSICLSKSPRQRDGWVVFPCNHGVCSRCFQHLIDTQVSMDAVALALAGPYLVRPITPVYAPGDLFHNHCMPWQHVSPFWRRQCCTQIVHAQLLV